MLVGCTFLDRRDAAGALVAHAVIFRAVINFAVPRTVNGTGQRSCYNWRILHGRCPIIGLGGTKQSGLGPNKHWPLVCHHMEYKKGEPWSLVALCNSTINLGLEYLEGDPAADP